MFQFLLSFTFNLFLPSVFEVLGKSNTAEISKFFTYICHLRYVCVYNRMLKILGENVIHYAFNEQRTIMLIRNYTHDLGPLLFSTHHKIPLFFHCFQNFIKSHWTSLNCTCSTCMGISRVQATITFCLNHHRRPPKGSVSPIRLPHHTGSWFSLLWGDWRASQQPLILPLTMKPNEQDGLKDGPLPFSSVSSPSSSSSSLLSGFLFIPHPR